MLCFYVGFNKIYLPNYTIKLDENINIKKYI